MDYAIELGLLDSNPIQALKWTAPNTPKPGTRIITDSAESL